MYKEHWIHSLHCFEFVELTLIYRLSLGKDNAQSNTKTSLQKLAEFSAEVGGVLCRSWRSSLQKLAEFSAEVGGVLCRSITDSLESN